MTAPQHALHLAINNDDVFGLLTAIEDGADLNLIDLEALFSFRNSSKNNVEIIDLIADIAEDINYDVNELRHVGNFSFFMYVCARPRFFNILMKMIRKRHVLNLDANKQTDRGRTALMLALANSLENAMILLDNAKELNLDLNLLNDDGQNAMFYAEHSDYFKTFLGNVTPTEIINKLRELGADEAIGKI